MKIRYTIRDVDGAVDKAVREEAAHYGLSLNKTVAKLLAKAVGLAKAEEGGAKPADLPAFEPWSKSEIESMRKELAAGRKIDPRVWK
jgi:hypothetical protein